MGDASEQTFRVHLRTRKKIFTQGSSGGFFSRICDWNYFYYYEALVILVLISS